MKPFTSLTAVAVPLNLANIDTDQIIPARFLGRSRAEQVDAMFRDFRYLENGSLNPDFVLNQTTYKAAQILVTDENLGCGSSRESAVTVMMDNGFRVFIAPSFGDIFYNNCLQNGVLPVQLSSVRVAQIRNLLSVRPGATLTIDLENQTVLDPDGHLYYFEIDSFRKACLIQGMDSIDLTLSMHADIEAFEEYHRKKLYWLGSLQ